MVLGFHRSDNILHKKKGELATVAKQLKVPFSLNRDLLVAHWFSTLSHQSDFWVWQLIVQEAPRRWTVRITPLNQSESPFESAISTVCFYLFGKNHLYNWDSWKELKMPESRPHPPNNLRETTTKSQPSATNTISHLKPKAEWQSRSRTKKTNQRKVFRKVCKTTVQTSKPDPTKYWIEVSKSTS